MSKELVTIATFASEAEAQLVRGQLEEAGVQAFVEEGGLVGWGIASDAKLLVAAEDARRAVRLLSEAEDDDPPPKAPASEQITERPPRPTGITDEAPDDEDSPPLTGREGMAVRALRAALLGVLLWPLHVYVSWLLLRVYLSDEALGDGPRWRAWVALLLNVPIMAILGMFTLACFGLGDGSFFP